MPNPADPALLSLLSLPPSTTLSLTPLHGGTSSAKTYKLTITHPTTTTHEPSYFLKTSSSPSAKSLFLGEHTSLQALSSAVPHQTLCPKSHGFGELALQPGTWFLVSQYFDFSVPGSGQGGGDSLARKLARLHSVPAAIPTGYAVPQFGFPVATCCGDTVQENGYMGSWAGFFAENRLRVFVEGADGELEGLVERTVKVVVPALLREGHLGGQRGVGPVVVHGDLWGGNWGVGALEHGGGGEEVVFDPSACYAHSEFELGIMRMFPGGLPGGFLEEYHRYVPKTEPVDEYEDRVALYELYHHLNHHAMFGRGYRAGAMRIMRRLLQKHDKPTSSAST